MNNREATTYNAIIGITKSHELVVLEDIFTYKGSSLRGATGYTMRILTQTEIDERNEPSELKEYWQQAVEAGTTEDSLEDWSEGVKGEMASDQYFPLDDTSFREQTKEIYNKLSDEDRTAIENVLGVLGTDFVDFDCQSCGSCIPTDLDDYEVLLRPDLLEKVIEAKN